MIGRVMCALGAHWYIWYDPRRVWRCARCRKEVRA